MSLENDGSYLLVLEANVGISFQHLELEPNKVSLVICPSLCGFGDVGQQHIGKSLPLCCLILKMDHHLRSRSHLIQRN